MSPTKHHPCGPSTLNRNNLCPGSLKLSEGMPERETDDGIEGRHLHIATRCVLEPGRTPWRTLDAEQGEQVEKCKAFFLEHVKGGSVQFETTMAIELPSGRYIEDYGTADLLAFDREENWATVIDWKFGRRDLEDGLDLQLSAYALMAHQLLGVDTVDAYVYQPRLDRTYHLRLGEDVSFEDVANTIEAIIDQAEASGAPIIPGPVQCRYCPALARCGVAYREAMAIAERPAQSLQDPRANREMLEKLRLAKKIIEANLEDLESQFKSGACDIEGYTVRTNHGARFITDPGELYYRLRNHVSAADFVRSGKYSLSGVQKACGLKPKEFEELAGDTIQRRADYPVIVKARNGGEA